MLMNLIAGIGFSKDLEGNLELMKGLQIFREQLQQPLHHMPILAGFSRKRFLADIIGEQSCYPLRACTCILTLTPHEVLSHAVD